MITIKNFTEKMREIRKMKIKLPSDFEEAIIFTNMATYGGTDWDEYHSSPDVKETIDELLLLLNRFLDDRRIELSGIKKNSTKQIVKKSPAKQNEKKEETTLVERMPEELRFIKRFINMNGKKKTNVQVLFFINALQRAIVEKRIRKSSPYAKQVRAVQEKAIHIYNNMDRKHLTIHLSPQFLNQLKELVSEEKIYPSIQFIKRFVNLHGKTGIKDRAIKLMNQIKDAINKKRIKRNDPYFEKVNGIWLTLHRFTGNKTMKIIPVNKTELNGLMGILNEESLDESDLSGLQVKEEEIKVINSLDFANQKFETVGFSGKWLDFFGDPAPGFTVMVYALPKKGKSYWGVEFAKYLAENFGRVLYVANEEKLEATLLKKVTEKNAKHANLDYSDGLPTDLSEYDFIFLDSVTKLGLSPKDLENLEKENPGKSFIYIHQSTKAGNFRGANDFQHDVDMVVKFPEGGRAVQFGRYNQGGEMNVFEDEAF